MFLYLGIASFAPIVMGLRPGWWVPYYYGALLVWWVLVSVATVRRVTREDRKGERRRFRTVRRGLDAKITEAAEGDAPYTEPTEERLIVVARDQVGLYDRIRRGLLGDKAVRVITDRRRTDRRLRLEVYIPDRRRAERRHHDIAPLLLTQGWARVTAQRADQPP
jgi:hypothetical protein